MPLPQALNPDKSPTAIRSVPRNHPAKLASGQASKHHLRSCHPCREPSASFSTSRTKPRTTAEPEQGIHNPPATVLYPRILRLTGLRVACPLPVIFPPARRTTLEEELPRSLSFALVLPLGPLAAVAAAVCDPGLRSLFQYFVIARFSAIPVYLLLIALSRSRGMAPPPTTLR